MDKIAKLQFAWQIRHWRIKPTDAFYWQSKGMAKFRRGDFGEAIKWLDKSRDHPILYRDILGYFYTSLAWAGLSDFARERVRHSIRAYSFGILKLPNHTSTISISSGIRRFAIWQGQSAANIGRCQEVRSITTCLYFPQSCCSSIPQLIS